jgi:16S rRNA (cytosine967-C5)-methyltransferase
LALLSPARETAFRVLKSVHGGAFASDSLRRSSIQLDSRDAGLAETIVFGCLRREAQLDYLIGFYSGRAQKLDPEVRIALRMGIFQLRHLDRIPAHAAVAESVELVKCAHKRSAAGFVNAVLRKVNRRNVEWPDRATELSTPEWMIGRWEAQFGRGVAEGIARAALEEPEVSIAATGRQQDLGAQTIVPYLQIDPGMTVLDTCAAPGNKTAQMLLAGASVVACDRSARRLEDVPREAMRVVADATRDLPLNTKFDRILVDAPCSGTGTLGRNPEIKWRLLEADLQQFRSIQWAMIQHTLPLLKPGGRMVYSTCSLESEENEEVVRGWPVVETARRLPGIDPGDGFFIAVLRP